MQKLFTLIISSFLILLLNACGGGGSGSSNKQDTTTPIFTSSATNSVNENQTSAITLIASDENNITYSISGGDASLFNINTQSGVVTFVSAPDFENPNDSDTNNIYTFTASASDGTNNATQDISITVLNVIPTNIGNLKTGQTTSYVNGDDGYYQKGISRNFTRGGNIVTDYITNLMWQDDNDAKTITKPWVTQANYDDHNYSVKWRYSKYILYKFNSWRL